MKNIGQKVCQFLKLHLEVRYNDSEIEELTNYILKSDIFKNEYMVELVNSRSIQMVFSPIVSEVLKGIPIQYILHEAYFMDLVLYVDESVLIPRPETEELVFWIQSDHKYKTKMKLWDVGTGSGCMAIHLKKCFPDWSISALDIDVDALNIAKGNADKYETQIEFLELDFLNFDTSEYPEINILVSNPPYIGRHEKHLMSTGTLSFEPSKALFPIGDDHLVFYKHLADFGQKKLSQYGYIYCELNEYYSDQIYEIFKQSGYQDIEVKMDLQGKARMLRCRKERND
jgi:release factor glutamine methyltransferase